MIVDGVQFDLEACLSNTPPPSPRIYATDFINCFDYRSCFFTLKSYEKK